MRAVLLFCLVYVWSRAVEGRIVHGLHNGTRYLSEKSGHHHVENVLEGSDVSNAHPLRILVDVNSIKSICHHCITFSYSLLQRVGRTTKES